MRPLYTQQQTGFQSQFWIYNVRPGANIKYIKYIKTNNILAKRNDLIFKKIKKRKG